MSQIESTVITKDDIADYVDKMDIKKSNIGGYDKVDVYVHIHEIIRMYGVYAAQELSRQKETLEEQTKEIEELKASEKAAREELSSRQAADSTKEQELERQKNQITDLMHYKELADNLQGENDALKRKIVELQNAEERNQAEELSRREERNKAEELARREERNKAEELVQELKGEKEAIQKENAVLNQKIAAQQVEMEELQKTKEILPEQQEKEAAEADKKAKELGDELDRYMGYARELKEKVQMQKNEINELGKYKERVRDLEMESERQKEELEEQEIYKESVSDLKREIQEQKLRIEELLEYENTARRLKEKVVRMREETRGLQQPGIISESMKKELESRDLEITELKDELHEQQELFANNEKFYKNMLQRLESAREIGDRRKSYSESPELQAKLREQEQIIMEKEQKIRSVMQELENREKELERLREEGSISLNSEAGSYSQEIGEILREARREGQNIIDNARIEAEQEMIRLLNVRAKFKQEKEVYENWRKRIETEKASVEEFLKQLSVQYENADRVLSSVKERAASFDIRRIFKATDSQQGNAEEANYEEKGLL